jgi:S-DNA-T family DNA segregation ATPase FtsK/SpoIIIE
MELLLRVHSARGTTDIAVDVDPDHHIGQLATAIAEFIGVGRLSTVPNLYLLRQGTFPPAESLVLQSGILSGDEVAVDPSVTPGPQPPVPVRGVSVDVLGGPDSGLSVILDRGSFRFGRDEGCDVVVNDQTVSREHLLITIANDWKVTVSASSAALNGLMLNDTFVASGATCEVNVDDVIAIGATRVAFRDFVRSTDEQIDQLGQIEFHRTPYRRQLIRDRSLGKFGPIPSEPEKRRFQILALVAPLVGGVAMYAFGGRVQYLALTLLSPLIAIANWFEDRLSGRTSYSHLVERFRKKLADHEVKVRTALEDERIERVRSAPDLAELARRAELRTIDLWARGRGSEDFLVTRLGIGNLKSLVSAEVELSGDDELRDEAIAVLDGHDIASEVPVTVALADCGVLGIHGPLERVSAATSSILVQTACLHSPEDLIIVSSTAPDRKLNSWVKWLPHTRSVISPLSGNHVVTTTDGSNRLIVELIELAQLRSVESQRDQQTKWPWILAVLDDELEPDATLVSQLLRHCPESGISVVWMSSSETRIPRQARAILDCENRRTNDRALLWFTDPEHDSVEIELSEVREVVADSVARSLAPVRDASVTTSTTAIPRIATLLNVLGTDDPNSEWVISRWKQDRPYGLEHPVGLGVDGVFSLDLVAQGPHALIGGTSGSGKSELLQSMVSSLMTVYPPSHLNFLFVDYKGGASSAMFADMPHTSGSVTNLNSELALRALTSLRAELNRRMHLMEGKAKDLEEMLRRHPDEAPPSLVIVVDEFATLVKEIPDFVAGIVDIAQRGRSLGIHLILATQRPSGSVNDNILANTNLRISLRMLDTSESSAVIGSPEAASIPVPLRGRGFSRLGPRELVPFQSAYSGAPVLQTSGETTIVLREFDPEHDVASSSSSTDFSSSEPTPLTQLDLVLDGVKLAAVTMKFPRPRAPWREVLASHIALPDCIREADERHTPRIPGRHVVMGMVDAPEQQDQFAAVVDLEDSGGLMVFGSGGAGKTTLLRTIAAAASNDASVDDVVIFGIDFASRSLRSLDVLPHVSTVATGDDLEAVTRILALLGGELEHRRAVLSDARAETLTAYHQLGNSMPRIMLLVDGFPNAVAAFSGGSFGNSLEPWLELLIRLVVDGRQVGIHTVMTADRRAGVPSLIQSAVSERVILRQADENGYADHGISVSRAKSFDLSAGQGFWNGDLCQVACVSKNSDAASQADAISEMANQLHGLVPDSLRSRRLPDTLDMDPFTDMSTPTTVAIGVCDLTLEPAVVDLRYENLLISGPPRSGRSTALVTIVSGLQKHHQPWIFGPTSSPLGSFTSTRTAYGRADVIMPLLSDLASVAQADPNVVQYVVIDDLDSFDDVILNPLWELLARLDNLRFSFSVEPRNITSYSNNSLLSEVRRTRSILFLQPTDSGEVYQLLNVRAPIRPGLRMITGRGVLLGNGASRIIQVGKIV